MTEIPEHLQAWIDRKKKGEEGHKPLTKQRSPWLGEPSRTIEMPGPDGPVTAHFFRRTVGDGTLWAIVSQEPRGWHLSISFRNQANQLSRYPSWDEQVHAVRELMPPGLAFHMILPVDNEGYVSLHDTTFHWHEYHDEELP